MSEQTEPLSAARLAEIRSRHHDDWYDGDTDEVYHAIGDLLAEVDRLRAALAALAALAAAEAQVAARDEALVRAEEWAEDAATELADSQRREQSALEIVRAVDESCVRINAEGDQSMIFRHPIKATALADQARAVLASTEADSATGEGTAHAP